jgi:alkylhydroperoxidase/carboxymuconolactone decarboxylase family protein YurZ
VRREHEDLLRRLAVSDPAALEALLGAGPATGECARLDDKTAALVRLAAFVAQGASSASYQAAVADALAAGVTDSDVVGTLLALAPVVGTVRVESAIPDVSLALGRDLGLPGGSG